MRIKLIRILMLIISEVKEQSMNYKRLHDYSSLTYFFECSKLWPKVAADQFYFWPYKGQC